MVSFKQRVIKRGLPIAIAIIGVIFVGYQLIPASYGATIGQRSLQLNNAGAGAIATYKLSMNYATTGTLGSVSIQFCSNDPLPNTSCTAPAGFNASQAVLSDQSGVAGFTISGNSTVNNIILTRSPAPVTPIAASYTFDTVTNPSTPGSYYVRVQTYATSDASGSASDYGGLAFAIANALSVTATVPPYLIFCAAVTIANLNCANSNGNYIDLGELSSTRASHATSQFLIATNASSGYSVTYQGGTLTSGNNIITAVAAADASRPGTAQYGFNLRSNNSPGDGTEAFGPGVSAAASGYNQSNFYKFSPGDTLVSTTVPDDVRQFTSSYLVNVPRTQPAGIYVGTVTYICLANF